MIHLPPRPQRAWLQSFWLALSLMQATLIAVLSWLYGTQFLVWEAVAALLLIPGMIWPEILAWPYRAWNKLARTHAGFAEALILKVSFLTIIVPTAWVGSNLRLDRPQFETSLWVPRQSLPAAACKELQSMTGESHRDNWIARYVTWACRSRQMWRLALLPFLVLLSWFQTQEEDMALPENIYTLF
jgi:hypothetical protein